MIARTHPSLIRRNTAQHQLVPSPGIDAGQTEKRRHKVFFTNHTREPGMSLSKACKQTGKSIHRKQLHEPIT